MFMVGGNNCIRLIVKTYMNCRSNVSGWYVNVCGLWVNCISAVGKIDNLCGSIVNAFV